MITTSTATAGNQINFTTSFGNTRDWRGQVVNLFASAVSGGGSYTLAVSGGGTLTLNAANEGAVVMRNAANDAWVVVGLSGATIV